MSKSTALIAGVLIFSLVLSGVAFAQEAYSVSGPASGSNVEPSTAIQKENEAIVDARRPDPELLRPHGVGAAGVEGSPGTQSGR
ncbi:MAG: hypothetical protein ACLP4V_34335 [Methylocella sp.]